MTSIFDVMIFDDSEIDAANAAMQASRAPDPRVCICGHGARAHSSFAKPDNIVQRGFREIGVEKCLPARQECPCDTFRSVVLAKNVRGFVFKTTGAYGAHALSKGIQAAIKKGIQVEPVGEWACDACGSKDKVGPVPLNPRQRVSSDPTAKNFLLCAGCFQQARLGALFSGVGQSVPAT